MYVLTPRSVAANYNRMTKLDQDAVRNRIRRLIAEKAEGKQIAFAEMTGIQASMLSKMMRGREPFHRRHLQKIEASPVKARLLWLERGTEPIYYEGEAPERSPNEHFDGTRLRNYLDENNIEYAELARRLNRAKNTVSGYFNSENINDDLKSAIAKELGVSEEVVFGYKTLGSFVDRPKPGNVRAVTASSDFVRVQRIPINARVNFNPDSMLVVSDEMSVDVPRSWMREGKTHTVIDVDATIIPPFGGSVLAYQADEDEWPYLDRFVAVGYRDQFQVRIITDNNLAGEGVLTVSTGGASPTTVRIPKNEIRSLWKVIHNMGGPM